MNTKSDTFQIASDIKWEDAGDGIYGIKYS